MTWVDFPLIRDANVRYQSWNRTAHFLSRFRDFAAAACVLVHVSTQVVTVSKPYGVVVQRACIRGGGGKGDQGKSGRLKRSAVSFFLPLLFHSSTIVPGPTRKVCVAIAKQEKHPCMAADHGSRSDRVVPDYPIGIHADWHRSRR